MSDRLSDIRERERAATPGPWRDDQDGYIMVDDGRVWRVLGTCRHGTVADPAFIANAREDIPWLLSEIERLTKERDDAMRAAIHADNELHNWRDLLR